MKKNRDNFYMIFMLVILLILTVFSGVNVYNNTDDDINYQVTIMLDDSTSSKWNTFRLGMRAAAKEYHMSLNILTSPSEPTEDEEKKMMQEMTDSHADAFVFSCHHEQLSSFYQDARPAFFINQKIDDESNKKASFSVDFKSVGTSLAQQLLRSGNEELHTVGIVSNDVKSMQTQDILEGFQSVIDTSQLKVLWEIHDQKLTTTMIQEKQNTLPSDIIVAFDTASTETSVDYIETSKDTAKLYGMGTSDKCVYYTDLETIQTLVVPDIYYMGYHTIKELHEYLEKGTALSINHVNYRMITKANMFTEKNQKLLFPIS